MKLTKEEAAKCDRRNKLSNNPWYGRTLSLNGDQWESIISHIRNRPDLNPSDRPLTVCQKLYAEDWRLFRNRLTRFDGEGVSPRGRVLPVETVKEAMSAICKWRDHQPE